VKSYVKARGVRSFAEAKRDAIGREGHALGRRDGRPDACDLPERLDEIRALLRQVDPNELVDVLDVVVRDWPWFRDATVAWVHLIDTLAQTAERRYAPKGRGEHKKEEVKGVIVYLMRAERFDIPRVPVYLEPVVIDVVADITVDAIVGLWNTFQPHDWLEATFTPPVAEAPRRAWLRVKRFLERVVFAPVARAMARVYWWVRRPSRLTPAVQSAVEAIARDSRFTGRGGVFERVASLARDLSRNRESLVAGVQIVAIVADVVEDVQDMDGPQKKACAKVLFYDVLDDLGVDTSNWIVKAKLDIGLDLAIDAVVALLNKRKLFVHQERPRPAIATAGARPVSRRRSSGPR
jgi:hypothetical protein